jgi:transposase
LPGGLAIDQPGRTCSPTPPIRVASVRLPPSPITASASSRRTCFASRLDRARPMPPSCVRALAEPDGLPAYARGALAILLRRPAELTEEIGAIDRELGAWHAGNAASQRRAALPGISVITATAIAATLAGPEQFRSGRQFAAWIGLTPQSTGGKTRHGGISSTSGACWSSAPPP